MLTRFDLIFQDHSDQDRLRYIDIKRRIPWTIRTLRYHDVYQPPCSVCIIIHTEAERRRREAGVQQAIENGLRSCLYECVYVCLFVCMFFKDITRSRALSDSKVVSCCSPVNSTLHRHDIIRLRFLTSACHVKIEKLLP